MGTHYIILLAFYMLNILKNKYVSLKVPEKSNCKCNWII